MSKGHATPIICLAQAQLMHYCFKCKKCLSEHMPALFHNLETSRVVELWPSIIPGKPTHNSTLFYVVQKYDKVSMSVKLFTHLSSGPAATWVVKR